MRYIVLNLFIICGSASFAVAEIACSNGLAAEQINGRWRCVKSALGNNESSAISETDVAILLARIAILEETLANISQPLPSNNSDQHAIDEMRKQTAILAKLVHGAQSDEQLSAIADNLAKIVRVLERVHPDPWLITKIMSGALNTVTRTVYMVGNSGLAATIALLLFSAAVPAATPYFTVTAPAAGAGTMAKVAVWLGTKLGGAVGAATVSAATAIGSVSPSLWLSASLGSILPVNYLLVAGVVTTLNLSGQMTRFNEIGFKGIVVATAKDAVEYIVDVLATAPGAALNQVAAQVNDVAYRLGVADGARAGRQDGTGYYPSAATTDGGSCVRLEDAVPGCAFSSSSL